MVYPSEIEALRPGEEEEEEDKLQFKTRKLSYRMQFVFSFKKEMRIILIIWNGGKKSKKLSVQYDVVQSVSQSCGINEARVFKWFAWSQISFQFSGEFLETTAFHSILSFLVLKRLSLLPSHSTWKVETVKLTIILGRKTAGKFVSGESENEDAG